VVEQHCVADAHRSEVLACLGAAYPAQRELPASLDFGPTGSERSELDQPMAHGKQGFTFLDEGRSFLTTHQPCVEGARPPPRRGLHWAAAATGGAAAAGGAAGAAAGGGAASAFGGGGFRGALQMLGQTLIQNRHAGWDGTLGQALNALGGGGAPKGGNGGDSHAAAMEAADKAAAAAKKS